MRLDAQLVPINAQCSVNRFFGLINKGLVEPPARSVKFNSPYFCWLTVLILYQRHYQWAYLSLFSLHYYSKANSITHKVVRWCLVIFPLRIDRNPRDLTFTWFISMQNPVQNMFGKNIYTWPYPKSKLAKNEMCQ